MQRGSSFQANEIGESVKDIPIYLYTFFNYQSEQKDGKTNFVWGGGGGNGSVTSWIRHNIFQFQRVSDEIIIFLYKYLLLELVCYVCYLHICLFERRNIYYVYMYVILTLF